MAKRKPEDEFIAEFKKCKVDDEIISIIHYSERSRKWTVVRASGDTDICTYEELKNSPVFKDYIYKLLQNINKSDNSVATYIT